MFIYKINSSGWAFVQPNIWLQSEAATDDDGFTYLPNITPVCEAFFEMGRVLTGKQEVKSVDVLRLPSARQEQPLCTLVMYVDGTTFLASPYELPWLGQPVTPPVSVPGSLRTRGRDHVIDTRHAMARSMMEGIINQAKDVPVLRDQLEDILTVMDGGTVSNRMSDQ